MVEARRSSVTLQCAWCDKIQANAHWIVERRNRGETRYSRSLCDACLENQLDETQSLPILIQRHLDV